MLTRAGICVPPTVTYLPYLVSGSTLTAVGRSQLLARWPGTHYRVLSGIQRAAQTVLGLSNIFFDVVVAVVQLNDFIDLEVRRLKEQNKLKFTKSVR